MSVLTTSACTRVRVSSLSLAEPEVEAHDRAARDYIASLPEGKKKAKALSDYEVMAQGLGGSTDPVGSIVKWFLDQFGGVQVGRLSIRAQAILELADTKAVASSGKAKAPLTDLPSNITDYLSKGQYLIDKMKLIDNTTNYQQVRTPTSGATVGHVSYTRVMIG